MRRILFILLSFEIIFTPNLCYGRAKKRVVRTSATKIQSKTTQTQTKSDVVDQLPVTNTVPEVVENTVTTPFMPTESKKKVDEAVAKVQGSCSGIKSNLDTIFGLSVATTISSGTGTALAGGALASGLVKASKDKKIEKNEKEVEKIESDEVKVCAKNIRDSLFKLDNFNSEIEKVLADYGATDYGFIDSDYVLTRLLRGSGIGSLDGGHNWDNNVFEKICSVENEKVDRFIKTLNDIRNSHLFINSALSRENEAISALTEVAKIYQEYLDKLRTKKQEGQEIVKKYNDIIISGQCNKFFDFSIDPNIDDNDLINKRNLYLFARDKLDTYARVNNYNEPTYLYRVVDSSPLTNSEIDYLEKGFVLGKNMDTAKLDYEKALSKYKPDDCKWLEENTIRVKRIAIDYNNIIDKYEDLIDSINYFMSGSLVEEHIETFPHFVKLLDARKLNTGIDRIAPSDRSSVLDKLCHENIDNYQSNIPDGCPFYLQTAGSGNDVVCLDFLENGDTCENYTGDIKELMSKFKISYFDIARGKSLNNILDEKISKNMELLKDEFNKIIAELDKVKERNDQKEKLNKEIDETKEKSKVLGNVRTGLIAGATVISAVSTGTSLGATLTASKLAEKMMECNDALRDLRYAKAELEAEEGKSEKADEVLSVCTGFDESNIKSLKNLATANAVVSGFGTVAAGVGTVTSVMANKRADKTFSPDKRVYEKENTKALNTVSNILGGVTAGTSATSTAFSAVQMKKAKKDSEMAEKCERVL